MVDLTAALTLMEMPNNTGAKREVQMDQTNKSRWIDFRPDGKPRRKVGDLFWVDADASIRIVFKCSACGRGLLVPWSSSTPKEVRCRECVKAPHKD